MNALSLAAIIPAAGPSCRTGRFEPLLRVDGRPLIPAGPAEEIAAHDGSGGLRQADLAVDVKMIGRHIPFDIDTPEDLLQLRPPDRSRSSQRRAP